MMSRPRALSLAFAVLATGVYAVSLALVGLLPRLARPDAVAVGMTLDLVIVVPVAFYLLVVRTRRMPLAALLPVVALSFVAAALILPRDQRGTLAILEALVVPLEIALVGWIAWRAARAARRAGLDPTGDPLERIHRVALETLGLERVAAALVSEIAFLHYAFFAWRARPHAPAGAAAFTHHRRGGHAGIVIAILLLLAVEGLAMHLLLARWSALAAWIFTVTSAYAGLWLIADHRATALRPILAMDDALLLRAGLRWSVRVPWSRIAAVERERPDVGRESLDLTLFGSPTHWIALTDPVVVRGPYGIRRRVRALGVEVDAPEAFGRSIGARRGAASDAGLADRRREPA